MDDTDQPGSLQAVADAILRGAGSLAPELRHAAFERATQLAGPPHTVTAQLPRALATFIEKVARHAYKVTDSDIDALHEAGFSDDAIFEAVIATAVGAGLSRLEVGLRALRREG